jgi:hypothetical protein
LFEIEDLWDQVFGYSFCKGDPYFQLTVAFWMPSGTYRRAALLDRCADLEFRINERNDSFAVEFFFVHRSGRVLDSNELFFELNPDRRPKNEPQENGGILND